MRWFLAAALLLCVSTAQAAPKQCEAARLPQHQRLICQLLGTDAGAATSARESLEQAGARAAAALLVALTAWRLEEAEADKLLGVLGAVGSRYPAAVPALTRIIKRELKKKERDDRVLRGAARALGALGSTALRAVPDLAELLDNQSDDVTEAASSALKKIGPSVISPLAVFIDKSQSPGAIDLITSFGRADLAAHMPALRQLLKRVKITHTGDHALMVVNMFRAIGPVAAPAIPELERFFLIGGELGIAAGKALAAIGKSALPVLLKALRHKNGDVRIGAAVALGEMDPPAIAAVPDLVKALEDQAVLVRRDAADSIGKMGRAAAAAVPALVKALADREADVRAAAAASLGEMGDKAFGAAPALIKLLRDSDRSVRQNAARSLGTLKRVDAIPALIRALQDESEWVRGCAARALGQMSGAATRAVPALVKAVVAEKSDFARADVAKSLGEFGRQAEQVAPALTRALRDSSGSVRGAAAASLGAMGTRGVQAIPALIALLRTEKTVEGQAGIARGLGRLGTAAAGAVPILTKLLAAAKKDPPRGDIAGALGRIGAASGPAIPALVRLLEDRSSTARAKIAACLGRLGAAAGTAVPALRRALQDPDENVREAAKAALGMIETSRKKATVPRR
jgi:HEAT repeat protein